MLNDISNAISAGDMRSFGTLIEDVLLESDMTVTQFAADNNLSRRTLYRTFENNDDPKCSTLQKILNGLNLELSVQPRKEPTGQL